MMFYSLRQTFFFLPSALGTSNFVIASERAPLLFGRYFLVHSGLDIRSSRPLDSHTLYSSKIRDK